MASSPARPAPLQTPGRLYAMDWLRVLATMVVFLFHVAHVFDTDLTASLKNNQTSVLASVYTFFVHQWMMEVFFLLAGASTWFSLRSRTGIRYLRERFQRLLIPFVAGSLVLVPWDAYMSSMNHATFRGPYWSYFPVHFVRTWQLLETKPEFHHGMAGLFETSWHLWFLGYLFVFSAAALPLFGRAGAGFGSRTVSRLAALSSQPWGIAAMGLPIVIIRVALTARFPVYLDWSDTVLWFTLFVYGWFFMADARFLRAVQAQAIGWLVAGCACFAIMLGTYVAGYLTQWLDKPGYRWDYLAFQVLCGVHTWAWIIAVTGLSLRWLNFGSGRLNYLGEAVLPFYILHQPAILTIGLFVVQWQMGILSKFLVITVAAFIVTLSVYDLAVRRNRILRTIFGMKPLQNRPSAS